jgi:hypothetical protein
MIKSLLTILCLCIPLNSSGAETLLSFPSTFPLHLRTASLNALDESDVLVIAGKIEGEGAVTLGLRIDDDKSGNYASRYNSERRFMPGDFLFEVPLKGLRTVNHRVMNVKALQNLYFFGTNKNVTITLTDVRFKKALKFAEGTVALSFGLENAPLFQGFERVMSNDPRLVGRPTAILRPGADTLISSGFVGISQVKLPFKQGKAMLTLFTEDNGAWENLPSVLSQRIRVNGKTVHEFKYTPQEWIEKRYLKNGAHEAALPLNPWKDYGERRGGRLVIPVNVGDDGVMIELAGAGAHSTFLSALILEEGDQASASLFVEKERERLFNAFWRVRTEADAFPKTIFNLNTPKQETITLKLAKGEAERVEFSVVADKHVLPKIEIIEDDGLKVQIWAGQRRLVRQAANDTILDYTTGFWRADTSKWELSPAPRPYLLWVEASDKAKSGTIKVKITAGDVSTIVPIKVTILPITLPIAAKPAGFYHDEAVYLLGFKETRDQRTAQLTCDLAFLKSMGINGVAPSLSLKTIESDLELVKAFKPPYLAYTPAKRLVASMGLEKAAKIIGDTKGDILWAVADEPSNPDLARQNTTEVIAALRQHAPHAKLTAQLNSPLDMKFVPLIDTALINFGFGVEDHHQQSILSQGKKLWFYNLSNARLASGFWLNRSKGDAYLQWHSRMPTADPFDPTDGREGDVQVFPPTAEVCPDKRDVTTRVFELSEGIVDQRWMIWLRTQNAKKYQDIMKKIDGEMAKPWPLLSTIKNESLGNLRHNIKSTL